MISKEIARAVTNKIKKQMPDNANAKLMFAVFETAVSDLFNKAQKSSAVNYISKEMPHLEIIGIDSAWARGLLVKAGLEI